MVVVAVIVVVVVVIVVVVVVVVVVVAVVIVTIVLEVQRVIENQTLSTFNVTASKRAATRHSTTLKPQK